MESPTFRYQPRCSVAGCNRHAVYKVAAPWSDGTSRELKTYGLVCDRHREVQLARARADRAAWKFDDGETVGPIGVYQLRPGARDAELVRLAD